MFSQSTEPKIFVVNNCDRSQLLHLLHRHPEIRGVVVEAPSASALRGIKAQIIALDPNDPRECISACSSLLARGDSIVVLPLGAPTQTAHLLRHDDVFIRIADASRVSVLPCWLSRHLDTAETVIAGTVLPPHQVTVAGVREELYRLGAESFSGRTRLKESLALACIRSLKKRLFQTVVVDAFKDDLHLNGLKLLATALTLADWMRDHIPEQRIGIVLPPGAGAILTNLATVFSGKTPVNLNFTAGSSSIESAMSAAGIRSVITATALEAKLKNFPWPENKVDLPTVLQGIGKVAIARRMPAILALAPKALAAWHGMPLEGGDKEASLLFTSGSSGEPKGVPLSHANILSNVLQVAEILPTDILGSMLGCLPIFHSFGFTVTLWWPLLGGPRVVTCVSPLDATKLSEVIGKHRVALLLSTPTFLRGLLKKATREDMQAVKMVVLGAEKMPVDLAQAFEEKFGCPVREGYGLTETSPVISVNLIDSMHDLKSFPGQLSEKRGSAGRLLPGVAVRVTHPDTGERAGIFESGILSFAGSNIFAGYFQAPELNRVHMDAGWFKTGDIGRMDEDGFLHIEGRVSRFSKIAGEMVPHGTVEQHLHEIYCEGGCTEPQFVIASRKCDQRGEELVLITTTDYQRSDIAEKLRARGVPNLWVPYIIRKVESIPVLASGKFDLREIQRLAQSAE